MANKQNNVLQGKGGRDQVMPMSLNNITGAVVEKRQNSNSLLVGGTIPFTSMLDVPVTLVFEVGRTTITIRQLMEMNKGSFIELRQGSVDTIDIRINEKLYAYGETIALQHRYGIRFGDLEIEAGVEDVDD